MRCERCYTALPDSSIDLNNGLDAPMRSVTGDPTKVTVRRFIAFAIDQALILAATLAVWAGLDREIPKVPAGWLDAVDAAARTTDYGAIGTLVSELWNAFVPMVVVFAIVSGLYLVLFQGLSGVTLGKLLVGVRVVGAAGKAPGLGSAAMRWVLLPVDAALLCIPAAVSIHFTHGHRRLGDLVGATYVIDVSASGRQIKVTPRGVLALSH
jgi:uncharacterized RDD family membrane protein YckC